MLICSTIQALDETRRPRVKVTGLLAIYILCMVHCYSDTLTLPSLCLSLLYLPPFLTFPSYLHSLYSSSFLLPLFSLPPSFPPFSSSFLLPLFSLPPSFPPFPPSAHPSSFSPVLPLYSFSDCTALWSSRPGKDNFSTHYCKTCWIQCSGDEC